MTEPHSESDRIEVDVGDMATVMHASTEFEAEAVRAVLADAGIRSVMVPTGSNVFGFPLGASGRGIPVRVLPDELDRARTALAQAQFVGRSVDWDDVDVGEIPPDVQRDLGHSGLSGRAGGLLVAAGAVIAAVIGLLILGGIAMTIWNAIRAVGALLPGAAAAACLALCAGCAYTLEGRVLEGPGSAEVVATADGDMGGKPVAGVRIDLIRDHTNMNRTQVATAVSGKDGRFKLVVDAFGAGWMEEEWLVRAGRSGYQNVENPLRLPGSTGGKLLLVTVARGRSERFKEPETSGTILDEARQYDRGVGTMSR